MFLRDRPGGARRTYSPWVLVAVGLVLALVGVILTAIRASEALAPGRQLLLVPVGLVTMGIGLVMAVRGKRVDP